MNETKRKGFNADLFYYPDPNSGTSTTIFSGWLVPFNDTRSGSSVIGWRSRIKHKVDATSVFNGTRLSIVSDGSSGGIYYKNSKGQICIDTFTGNAYQDLIGFASDNPALLTAAQAVATSKLYKRIKQAQQDLSGGTFLGELGEAVHMIRNPAKSLRAGLSQYLNSLSKSVKPTMKKSTKRSIAANTWLEYSFGWAPFINDIQDGYKAYLNLVNDLNRFESIKVSGSAESSVPTSVGVRQVQTGWRHFYSTTIYRKATYRYICMVDLNVNGPSGSLQYGLSRFGLSDFTDFVPTIWELLPWSFLIDYFSNIGDVLSAVTVNTAGVRFVCGTARNSSYQILDDMGPDNSVKSTFGGGSSNWISQYGTLGSVLSRRTVVNRAPVSLPPVPSLAFELPKLSTQWINMAALKLSHNKTLSSFKTTF